MENLVSTLMALFMSMDGYDFYLSKEYFDKYYGTILDATVGDMTHQNTLVKLIDRLTILKKFGVNMRYNDPLEMLYCDDSFFDNVVSWLENSVWYVRAQPFWPYSGVVDRQLGRICNVIGNLAIEIYHTIQRLL